MRMRHSNTATLSCLALLALALAVGLGSAHAAGVLAAKDFAHFVERFNADDEDLYPSTIPNTNAWQFLSENIPLLDCPDREISEIYYFRWWTYRKHIQQTPEGYVVTEFLPKVPWAGKYNTINCPAAHHFYEGRWLRHRQILDDYATFWLRKGGRVRAYSFWIADALWQRHLVTGDDALMKDLLPDLVTNYHKWEETRLGTNGLFWQIDDRDGMEVSVGGSGYRPTINSYMFADARAIAGIAQLAGQNDLSATFTAKADRLKKLLQEKLWNTDQQFFQTIPKNSPNGLLTGVRELIGYTPWYFNLPDAGYETAWKHVMDTNGFAAPYGLTTVERRCPKFTLAYKGHECQWNGPSWPYSSAVTLTALANLLHNYRQDIVTKRDYLQQLQTYTRAQHLTRPDGKVVPWIDENLNPLTGDWMARTILLANPKKGIRERGKDYNHSTYCDLIITGLIGLRPRADDLVEVHPLLPDGVWDYFCLDQIPYHGRTLTILYDRTGQRYQRGPGLRLYADGKQIAESTTLNRITGKLPGK